MLQCKYRDVWCNAQAHQRRYHPIQASLELISLTKVGRSTHVKIVTEIVKSNRQHLPRDATT